MIKKLFLLLLSSSLSLLSSNWNPQYHYVALEQFEFAKNELQKIKLIGNEHILDVGCGTGRAANLFAQHVPQGFVLGIDNSEEFIKFAQDEYRQVSNVRFEVTDAAGIDFSEQFDIVCSFFCLHWVQDGQQAIKNIYRALKPGGKAYLYINVVQDQKILELMHSNIDDVIHMHPEWKSYLSLAHFLPAQAWINYIRIAGFILDNWYMTTLEHFFRNKLQCKAYNYTLGTTTLPNEGHRKFIDLVIDRLYEQCGVKDDEVFIQKAQIVVLEVQKSRSS